MKKPAVWCARCRDTHDDGCPHNPKRAWVNKKSKSGRGGAPWRKKREKVFIRDKFQCQACKRNGKMTFIDVHGSNAGICDHIIPGFEGGADDLNNLQTLCRHCNKEKTHAESLRGRGG